MKLDLLRSLVEGYSTYFPDKIESNPEWKAIKKKLANDTRGKISKKKSSTGDKRYYLVGSPQANYRLTAAGWNVDGENSTRDQSSARMGYNTDMTFSHPDFTAKVKLSPIGSQETGIFLVT